MASLSADLLGAIGDDAGQYCLYKSAATAVLSSLFVITTMSERRGTRAPALINSPPVPSPVGRLADSSCPTPCSLRLHLLHDHSVRPDHHFPGEPSIRKRPTQAPASQAFHQPHRRSISRLIDLMTPIGPPEYRLWWQSQRAIFSRAMTKQVHIAAKGPIRNSVEGKTHKASRKHKSVNLTYRVVRMTQLLMYGDSGALWDMRHGRWELTTVPLSCVIPYLSGLVISPATYPDVYTKRVARCRRLFRPLW